MTEDKKSPRKTFLLVTSKDILGVCQKTRFLATPKDIWGGVKRHFRSCHQMQRLGILSTRRRTNKIKSNTTLFLLAPPRTKWFFSQEKQRLFVSQHKGLTQTRTKTRGQSRRNFDLIFLYFLTLALFSDGKIRQQNPLSQKEGRKFKT